MPADLSREQREAIAADLQHWAEADPPSGSSDVLYLCRLLADALEDETFDSDGERTAWAVTQWCQEVRFLPDLRDYEIGQTVPRGDQRSLHAPNHPGLCRQEDE